MSRINEPETQEQSGTTGLREKAGEMAGDIRDAAAEKYQNVRDAAERGYEQGREKVQEWQHDLEDYIQAQPVKALLIAAGVGMVLGILWKRG